MVLMTEMSVHMTLILVFLVAVTQSLRLVRALEGLAFGTKSLVATRCPCNTNV